MRRLVVAVSIFAALLLGAGGTDSSKATSSFVLYGNGTLDPATSSGMQAIELPAGRLVGQVDVGGLTQGGGFALAPDGHHAYLLDRAQLNGVPAWRLSELTAPSLQVLRRVVIPDAIPLLGWGRVVAVAANGQQVYVETMRIIDPNRIDPQLRVGQPDSAYSIAVYDVARGAVTRQIPLDPPWCGVADLYALPNGNLAIYCYTSDDVRLVDVARGKEVARTGVSGVGSAVSPDGRRLWTVGMSGTLSEVDLTRMTVDGETELGPGDGSGLVPFQQLDVTADGKHLFVRAAPGDPENRADGNGTVVWIVDTEKRQRVATLALPTPAFDLAASPDGRMLVATTDNIADRRLFGTHLIEVASGRSLTSWPGVLIGTQIR